MVLSKIRRHPLAVRGPSPEIRQRAANDIPDMNHKPSALVSYACRGVFMYKPSANGPKSRLTVRLTYAEWP